MALKYIAGTLPRIGVYTLVMGTLSRLPSGSWELDANTVESVDKVGVGKEYNYAAGGVGIFAGAAFAGPVGAVVGGLLPTAFKDDVVQFVIRFRNGDVAHFSGSPADYRRALQASYKGARPVSAEPSAQRAEPPAARPEVVDAAFIRSLPAEPIERRPKDNPDAERLRAEIAADKQAARRTIDEVRAEMAAERAAREAAGDPLDGQSRLWFADVGVRQYVAATPNESPAEQKQRETLNEQYRKEYKKALAVVRKQHEKGITRNRAMKFTERMRLLTEIQKEFDYRTSK